jgi:hypothetical protein
VHGGRSIHPHCSRWAQWLLRGSLVWSLFIGPDLVAEARGSHMEARADLRIAVLQPQIGSLRYSGGRKIP